MTPDRFRTLAEAYGGDLARWPAADRAGAETFAAAHAEEAASILLAERDLDAWLDTDAVAVPAGLSASVLAAAPRARAARPVWRWVAAASLGLALAGSAAAGVAAGLTLTPPGVAQLISGPDNDASSLADPAGDVGAG